MMGIASDTYAEITRNMYDDWLNRFYPKQVELLQKSQSGQLLNEQLARVDSNANDAGASAKLSEANKMARYGLTPEGDVHRNAKLSLAKVAAKNGLRDHERDRSMQTLAGAGYAVKQNASVE
ncbi:hypothetical protein [Grimontia kaedaensis]|nr:hypothetical protein [Grimontia kaedaensis]